MLLVPVFFIIKNNINSRTLTLINLIFEFYKSIDITTFQITFFFVSDFPNNIEYENQFFNICIQIKITLL